MKGYKAFNKDMTCRGFQYEEGKTYEESKAECCESGFHFCENPLDVLKYYNLCESEFAEVEVLGEVHKRSKSNDTKAATTKIKIGAKIGLPGLIKASFEYLWEKCYTNKDENVQAASGNDSKLAASGYASQLAASGYGSQLAASGDCSKLAASGDCSQLAASGDDSKLAASGYGSQLAASGDDSKLAASGDDSKLAASGYASQLAASGDCSKLAASGDYSKLAASGDYSQLAASGDCSKLAASGDYSKLAASGDCSQLAASGDDSKLVMEGENSIGAAIGSDSIIKGKKGCWITLAEYTWQGDKHVCICVKSTQIDGETIKEDTWYKLENGEFVEVEQ